MDRLSACQVLSRFRDGSLSVTNYAERVIERQALLKTSNYLTFFEPDLVRKRAKVAQDRYESGTARPLEGLPIVFKDNISIKGEPNSGGTPSLWGRCPKETADVAQKLLDAGALNAGRANMHELAWGVTSHNRFTGPVRNFWNVDHYAGGSSGGSAAVVSADLVPVALGTDTGGSVRIPANNCGIFGYRPSVGVWPADYGLRMTHLRDTVGPMARCMEDIALLDTVMTGNDYSKLMDPREIRIGVPRKHYWDEKVHPEVRKSCEAFLDRLKEEGFSFVETDGPDPQIIRNATVRTADQINYELLTTLQNYIDFNGFTDLTVESVMNQIASPDVKEFVELQFSQPVTEHQYEASLVARDELINAHKDYAAKHNLTCWIFPTIKIPPPRLDDDSNDNDLIEITINNVDIGSIADHPGITMPCGRMLSTGVPFGIEIDGLTGTDKQLIQVALAIEKAGVVLM